MARGMVVGEPIVSQANTEAAREGYDRTFGCDVTCKGCGRVHRFAPEQTEAACECGQIIMLVKSSARGRWIWDESRKELVRAEDYRPPPAALNAPIIADRIHEGTRWDFGDGEIDIGSRRKRREAMKRYGVEDAKDCSPEWKAGIRKQLEREDNRKRREAMEKAARKLYAEGKWR